MLSFISRCIIYYNPPIRSTWRRAWFQKEGRYASQNAQSTEAIDMNTRPLAPLSLGDKVFLQNQRGSHPKKWDKSGTVVELDNYEQYWVKVDGEGPTDAVPPPSSTPPATPADIRPHVPAEPPASVRPRRQPKPCRHYVPETGKWQEH